MADRNVEEVGDALRLQHPAFGSSLTDVVDEFALTTLSARDAVVNELERTVVGGTHGNPFSPNVHAHRDLKLPMPRAASLHPRHLQRRVLWQRGTRTGAAPTEPATDAPASGPAGIGSDVAFPWLASAGLRSV